MKRAIINLIVPAVIVFTLAASAPLAAQETGLSERDSVLIRFLVLEGFKFQRAWEKIIYPDMDTTFQTTPEELDKDEIDLIVDQAPGRASLSFYRAALMVDSTIYWIHHMISYPLASLDSLEAAIAACDKSIELAGDRPNGFRAWLGLLYCENGQKEKALETFKKQILLDPTSEEFYEITKLYIEKTACDFPPEVIEEVLSLSKVHKVSKK